MDAGKLRYRITIQRQEQIQNPQTGAITTTWVDYLTNVPAEIQFLSARELIAAAATQSQVMARIIIRWRPDPIDPSMRIVHQGKIYNIHGAIPDNITGKQHYTLPCSQGVNDGN
ncbi:phage head closure protein [Halomonas daqingensis]|uniref:Phage head closure protein n=1 Tax=Billgrantia desiderata TaxID=52021 RepID=A0AAW4YV88_9GAMM|nr:phage head closure protein [Halomonas desiderata]MCE8052280.1 phage head closure protein [Halomonas desiderata]